MAREDRLRRGKLIGDGEKRCWTLECRESGCVEKNRITVLQVLRTHDNRRKIWVHHISYCTFTMKSGFALFLTS